MISMDKKYRTRDGKPARVICTDRKGGNPVLVLVMYDDGKEYLYTYRECGRILGSSEHHPLDLIEVETRKRLMTIVEIFEKCPDACFNFEGGLCIGGEVRVSSAKLHRLGSYNTTGFKADLHTTEEFADED